LIEVQSEMKYLGSEWSRPYLYIQPLGSVVSHRGYGSGHEWYDFLTLKSSRTSAVRLRGILVSVHIPVQRESGGVWWGTLAKRRAVLDKKCGETRSAPASGTWGGPEIWPGWVFCRSLHESS